MPNHTITHCFEDPEEMGRYGHIGNEYFILSKKNSKIRLLVDYLRYFLLVLLFIFMPEKLSVKITGTRKFVENQAFLSKQFLQLFLRWVDLQINKRMRNPDLIADFEPVEKYLQVFNFKEKIHRKFIESYFWGHRHRRRQCRVEQIFNMLLNHMRNVSLQSLKMT